MPTSLPQRQPPAPPPEHDGGARRDLLVASMILVGALGLYCQTNLGPTPGYTLVPTQDQLQLSP